METPFRRALAECIAWCSSRVDIARPKETTRSPELRPEVFDGPRGFPRLELLLSSPVVPQAAVAHVVERRRRLLGAAVPVFDGLAGGRIYATDFNTDSCGSAEPASNGFIDEDDIPAWDTWFAHESAGFERAEAAVMGGAVYGWVPQALLDFADKGFYVIPVQSIWWVSDAELRRLLAG